METLIIVIAFWLVLLGIYGGISYARERSLDTRARARWAAGTSRYGGAPASRGVPEQRPFFASTMESRPAVSNQASTRPAAPSGVPAGGIGGLFSEVDELRAQVAHLRSEISALTVSTAERADRPRQRRYRTGVYTYLPRMLRRHVRRVRSFRRSPLRAAM